MCACACARASVHHYVSMCGGVCLRIATFTGMASSRNALLKGSRRLSSVAGANGDKIPVVEWRHVENMTMTLQRKVEIAQKFCI